MNLSTRMIIVLTLVGLVSGGLLTGVGMITRDRIAYNKQKEIEEAILMVVPGSEKSRKRFEERELTVYSGESREGQLAGYAVYTSGTGFQDKITLMYGVDPALTRIHSLKILEQQETPGLGANITDRESFLRYWDDKDISSRLTLRKPAVISPEELLPSEINTITGATISSEAVLSVVNQSLQRIKQLESEGKLTTGD